MCCVKKKRCRYFLLFLFIFHFSSSTSASLPTCAKLMSCGHPTALTFYRSSFSGHPWNVPSSPSSLILSGSWWVSYGSHPAAKEACVCVCVFCVLSVHIRERQWKNENRSFMAKSCSGWWRWRCMPAHSWASPLLFPIPAFIHFTIVCPTYHCEHAELQWLIASLNSTAVVHMRRY